MNNVYICSDDYNMDEADNKNTNLNLDSQAWGTWEELLLACAVKRHGFADWDSVATEVQSRSSLSGFLTSANICRQKYRDLRRRFQKSAGGESDAEAAVVEEEEDIEEEEESIGNIPWLEQLRKLRVAELRREVQQYDVSILSLQLKVKKLVEERGGDQKPDLEEDKWKGDRSEHREKVVSAVDESDRENRSMNESNSTDSGGKTAGKDERVSQDEPSETRDESCDNNPDLDPVYTTEEGSEASQSGELGETGTSGRKWKRKRREYTDGSKNNNDGEIRSAASKSIALLDLIRSHPRGSLFERRLQSQETKDYKSLVKQHLDIETLQRKLKQGSYDSSSLTFYRDLQLLFTNAIVFFPSSSAESMAAHELRTVVSEEARKDTGKYGPRLVNQEASAMTGIKADAETSESSLARQKSSVGLIVCKRRSFVSGKASPSSSSLSQKEEEKEETLSEEKENIATGVRSSRRTNKVVDNAVVISNNTKTERGKSKQKQTESKSNENTSKQERGKTEKKMVSSDKKKSVADFLERLKNSPQKEGKGQNKSCGSGKKEGKKKAEVEKTQVKRSHGRPQKKAAEAATTASRKRGRQSESTGKDNKQPKKRNRK